ncbi:type II secretion system minor pseudopilin GspI [Dasania marina]|uniref:type II secretion system minor pseudopilin GspI n=1 Tax=Dasania marina TaxID=471499 RepID=UPI00037AD75F|nr:type II secretion system minor pseudopilin GspI [Dasania marina]
MRLNKRGFTLLEVLVALAIFAISALAISRQIGNGHIQQQQLAYKTSAMLIAENEVAVLMLNEQWPALGRDEKRLQWAGLDWQLKREVTATSEPWLRQITVSVGLLDTPGDLVNLVSYRGRY